MFCNAPESVVPLQSAVQPSFNKQMGCLLVSGDPMLCCAVSCCRPAELEQLVCGGRVVDLSALESATHYQDGYHTDSKPVRWFWEVRGAS